MTCAMDSFNPLLMPISTPLSTPMSATDATDRSSHKKRSYHYSTPSQSSNQPRPSSLSTSSSSRPMSSHKKSFSTADVHAGMLLNPARERQSTPPRDEERSSTPATASIYHSHPVSRSASLFGESGCSRCGSRLTTRGQTSSGALFPHDLGGLLHLVCISCSATHCRGCRAQLQCPPKCSGGSGMSSASSSSGAEPCRLRECCSSVYALAIFEALRAFDAIFVAEVEKAHPTEGGMMGFGGSGKGERTLFLKTLLGKADKSMRRFEDAFMRALRMVCSWLQLSSSSLDEIARQEMVTVIASLFASSLLPEVIHAYLSHINVRDWIAHSEAYVAILETLRKMYDAGLAGVLMQPLQRMAWTAGMDDWVWDSPCSVSSSATSSASSSSTSSPASTSSSLIAPVIWDTDAMGRWVYMEPIGDLIKGLEVHRLPLMNLGSRVQFETTLEKVNMLCDGISYLLLQQTLVGLDF